MPQTLFFTKFASIITRYSQVEMSRRLEPYGIGMGQHVYLLEIAGNPGITQDRLTDLLVLNKSSVARAIVQLETAGYIRRDIDPADRRSYRLHLSSAGREVLDSIRAMQEEINAGLTVGFSDAEKAAATELMRRMAENGSACRRENTKGKHTDPKEGAHE